MQIWEGALQAEGLEGQRPGGGTIPGLFEEKVGCFACGWSGRSEGWCWHMGGQKGPETREGLGFFYPV